MASNGGNGEGRRCSQCGHHGHNSRTCTARADSGGVKLFGVRIGDASPTPTTTAMAMAMRKTVSMGNIAHYDGESPAARAEKGDEKDGYGSEDLDGSNPSSRREKKRGEAWTEHEHKMFLLGLHNLGKGDWRGISRQYVITRTPTQVASHAQKYFIRQSNLHRRKRRTSLFDMVIDEPGDIHLDRTSDELEERLENSHPESVPAPRPVGAAAVSAPPLPLAPQPEEQHGQIPFYSSNGEAVMPQMPHMFPYGYPMMYPPAFLPQIIPVPYPVWPVYFGGGPETAQMQHEVVRPTPVHSKAPVNVEDLNGLSELNLRGYSNAKESAATLPPKAIGRRGDGSGMDSSNGLIHAV